MKSTNKISAILCLLSFLWLALCASEGTCANRHDGHRLFLVPIICDFCGNAATDGARVGFVNQNHKLVLSLNKATGFNDGTFIGGNVSGIAGLAAESLDFTISGIQTNEPFIWIQAKDPNGIMHSRLEFGNNFARTTDADGNQVFHLTAADFQTFFLIPPGSTFTAIKFLDDDTPNNLNIFSVAVDGIPVVFDPNNHHVVVDCNFTPLGGNPCGR